MKLFRFGDKGYEKPGVLINVQIHPSKDQDGEIISFLIGQLLEPIVIRLYTTTS